MASTQIPRFYLPKSILLILSIYLQACTINAPSIRPAPADEDRPWEQRDVGIQPAGTLAISEAEPFPSFLAVPISNTNIDKLQLLKELTEHVGNDTEQKSGVDFMTFTPDLETLITSGIAGIITVETNTWQVVEERPQLYGDLYHLILDKNLAYSQSSELHSIWDFESGERKATFQIIWGVEEAAISPNQSKIAYAIREPDVQVRDSQTGELIHALVGHDGWVFSVDWHPDGVTLASGGSDADVYLWDTIKGEELLNFHVPEGVYSLAWSHDGNYLVVGGARGGIYLWNSELQEEIYRLKIEGASIQFIDWSVKDDLIAVGGSDGTIHFIDPLTAQEISLIDVSTNPFSIFLWTEDGTWIATNSDQRIRVWGIPLSN